LNLSCRAPNKQASGYFKRRHVRKRRSTFGSMEPPALEFCRGPRRKPRSCLCRSPFRARLIGL